MSFSRPNKEGLHQKSPLAVDLSTKFIQCVFPSTAIYCFFPYKGFTNNQHLQGSRQKTAASKQKWSWSFTSRSRHFFHMGVSKNRGKTHKMDGENIGNPYVVFKKIFGWFLMDGRFGGNPLFSETPTFSHPRSDRWIYPLFVSVLRNPPKTAPPPPPLLSESCGLPTWLSAGVGKLVGNKEQVSKREATTF